MPAFLVPAESLPYDPSDRDSILRWARSLRGRTLREVVLEYDGGLGDDVAGDRTRDKGDFGIALERMAFLLKRSNDPTPDLEEAGVEIKGLPVLPYKRRDGMRPKERLVLHNINYSGIVDETWESNSLRRKCGLMLVVTDVYERGVRGIDLVIKDAFYLRFPIPQDEPTIRADWERIQRKVLDGKAHEISSADTTYLEACRGGSSSSVSAQPFSDVMAKSRRFALKQSYVRTIYRHYERGLIDIPRGPEESELSLEELVRRRYDRFVGMTRDEIAERAGASVSKAKDGLSRLNRLILGLSIDAERNDEFDRAGYELRNPNFEHTGTLKESVSFPYIRYDELASESSWEESLLRSQISRRLCFVVWQKTTSDYRWRKTGNVSAVPTVLRGVCFTGIPESIIDTDGKAVWERTRRALAESSMESLPSLGDRMHFHVRPHSTRDAGKMTLPDGTRVTRQCFWINAGYVKELVSESIDLCPMEEGEVCLGPMAAKGRKEEAGGDPRVGDA